MENVRLVGQALVLVFLVIAANCSKAADCIGSSEWCKSVAETQQLQFNNRQKDEEWWQKYQPGSKHRELVNNFKQQQENADRFKSAQ